MIPCLHALNLLQSLAAPNAGKYGVRSMQCDGFRRARIVQSAIDTCDFLLYTEILVRSLIGVMATAHSAAFEIAGRESRHRMIV